MHAHENDKITIYCGIVAALAMPKFTENGCYSVCSSRLYLLPLWRCINSNGERRKTLLVNWIIAEITRDRGSADALGARLWTQE